MERLRALVEEYEHWSGLLMYVERIELNLEADFSVSLENAKSLLEAISKEICRVFEVEVNRTASFHAIVKMSFRAMGHAYNDRFGTVGSGFSQQLAKIRDVIGTTAHGRPLAELEQRNQILEQAQKNYLIDSVELLAVLLLNTFEQDPVTLERQRVAQEAEQLQQLGEALAYDSTATADFNRAWDQTHGSFEMGDYSYLASEVLFYTDRDTYIYEYQQHQEEQP